MGFAASKKARKVNNIQSPATQWRRLHLIDRFGEAECIVTCFPKFLDELLTRAADEPLKQKGHSKDAIGVLQNA
jgi:hypothetical protein